LQGATEPLTDVIHYELQKRDGHCHLQFDFNIAAWERSLTHRFGRTVLLTNRMDWTAEQVAAGYSGQQSIERVFRGLKDGEWLGWGRMHHWTDRKIRVHAFYCMFGISLLQNLHKQAQTVWDGISTEQLLEELQQSSSSLCSIHRRVTKDLTQFPSCSPSRPWLNNLSPKPWA
jgi:transposase